MRRFHLIIIIFHDGGPASTEQDPRDDIAEDMLLEVFRSVGLEVALAINGNSQHIGKYLLNPFMPVEEVLAKAVDDVLGVLGMATISYWCEVLSSSRTTLVPAGITQDMK